MTAAGTLAAGRMEAATLREILADYPLDDGAAGGGHLGVCQRHQCLGALGG